MTRPAVLQIRDLSADPLLPGPGLFWRSCGFLRQEASLARHDGVTLALPPDLSAAVPGRRAEFLAGRLCATLALRAAGSPGEVGRAGRAPVWPAGFSGSISHCGELAVAVVRQGGGLGVDMEREFPAETAAEVAPLLLTPRDRARRPPDWSEPRFATLLFSAKEALFKALSAGLADIPDFTEAALERLEDGQAVLRFRGGCHTVLWAFRDGLCLTLAA